MNRIREILLSKQILLDVKAATREEAITMVTASLQGDNRIINWPRFVESLAECERSGKVNMGLGLTIPHGRTESVTSMVMAFGRLAQPMRWGRASIQFVLVIGIPETMDADYLRLVGVLMRAFRDGNLRKALETAKTPEEVLATFEKGETQLT
jgi:mannitol/fructose-specific phosphotransferase system IIA component (Ntr-type)